jgi:uncharacterized protein YerC
MSFTVYDDNGTTLASFDDYAKAAQYVYNNDDIAAFINDERVTPEKIQAIEQSWQATPATVQTTKPVSKLLTAAQAIKEIEALQAVEVQEIIKHVIQDGGAIEYPVPHKLIIKKLRELGYTVEYYEQANTVTISIPMED